MKLLDTSASNTKIKKSQKESGLRIASLSLYPNDTICPAAILAGCKEPCLVEAGFGAFSNVRKGRQAKTALFMESPATFVIKLEHEIDNFISLCTKQGKKPAFRLNTISDIPWERYGIPQNFPQAYFFDYTKSAQRLHNLPPNYDMIFSYSQEPKYQKQVKRALLTDRPVAVVFRGFVPVGSYFLGREIVDGDLSDIKNQKQRGKIIGLKLKGNKAKKSKSLFIVDPSQATQCPAQAQNCFPKDLAQAGKGFLLAAE